ncbi:AMP-binding protein [Thermophagus xiamenensis]|uniref:O-succinylbenzoic acid--CoA ligase n=1 Tax=Thermophagus xiamenensis TaxID=385682 RepID=A0A1I2DBP5_9BACT|nr:AMP-binding protein [Thermophagus xiamenensis]SFE77982.1 O-succinylbenzoic acid--CoA ligase [Thermophagus xiamenensis]
MQYNFKAYRQLTIYGETYHFEDLMTLCHQKLADAQTSEWERALYAFIAEWLSDDEYVEIQTSGSTGKPKKMKAAKSAMLHSAFNTIEFFRLKPGMKALLCLPAGYIAGKMMVVRAFAGELNLLPVPVCGRPLQYLSESVDFAALTPMQMMNELTDGKSALHLLKRVILGGSAVTALLENKLKSQPFRAWETYGMTETLSHIALRPLNGPKEVAFFTPLNNVKVTTDSRGCLMLKAGGITNDWIVTNDLAEINEDGTFRINGRFDNIINTGGIKVSPEVIEKKIEGIIPGPFYISSRPHASLGQEIVLVVEKKPKDVHTILKQLKNILPPYQAPRDIVEKRPFPMTANGKIKRV